jgi:hypothetical protein
MLTDVDLNANSRHDHAKKIGEIIRLRSRGVRRTVEASREIFDCADVMACGSHCVVTTLEFL